jgi:hypothetical protein
LVTGAFVGSHRLQLSRDIFPMGNLRQERASLATQTHGRFAHNSASSVHVFMKRPSSRRGKAEKVMPRSGKFPATASEAHHPNFHHQIC